jgi:hypothetical protein
MLVRVRVYILMSEAWKHRDEFGAPRELARKREHSLELSETRVQFGALGSVIQGETS